MIAFLPMYDWPGTAAALDRFWARVRDGLRARGIAAPEALSRGVDLPGGWLRDDLVLSQTCGLPFARTLRGRVDLVAAVDHGLADLPPGAYRSRVVVRADDPVAGLGDLAGRVAAINSDDSQSGSGALRRVMHEAGARFGRVVATGAHAESLRAVAEGRADAAAIDAVSWELARRWVPQAGALRVLGSTPPTPGLPFITRVGGPVAALRAALGEAVEGIGEADRATLMMRGLVDRRDDDFDDIARWDREAGPLA